MRYCKRCVLPDTRPNLIIGDDGVCSACRVHEEKPTIDWAQRAALFEEVASIARGSRRGYDCVVPVSGGKDSHWQVITCLEHGLKPLAVTWRCPGRTKIGQRNLANLVSLGVDHIDFSIDPTVEKSFMLKSLKKHGTPALPMHMAIFQIPRMVAVRFSIPLVVWGENAAFEYGSADESRTGFVMDRAWLKLFGVTHGTFAEDWISEDLSEKSLTPYFGPTDEELETAGVSSVFLGYYFQWDPKTSLAVASGHGFESRIEGPRVGYYDYADIDDHYISVHHYLKWYKFGFTRLFDNLSLEIRNNRLTRAEALDIILQSGEQKPSKDIARMCRFLGIANELFYDIIEPFRNREIWAKRDGCWFIRDFLIPDWKWK